MLWVKNIVRPVNERYGMLSDWVVCGNLGDDNKKESVNDET